MSCTMNFVFTYFTQIRTVILFINHSLQSDTFQKNVLAILEQNYLDVAHHSSAKC